MQEENPNVLFSVDDYIIELLTQDNVIMLPCKIGDIVYINERYWNYREDPKSNLVPWKITSYSITCNKKNLKRMKYRAYRLNKKGETTEPAIDFEFDDIDKSVFLGDENG